MELCKSCNTQLCGDICELEPNKNEVLEEIQDLLNTINVVNAALEDLNTRLKILKQNLN